MGIEVVGVHKRFGSVVAVRDLRLHAQPGELLAIVGPSGCGKTTLLRVIAGLEEADAGRVVIGGRDATHLPPEKRNVGFVFQQFALFPNMNVAENIGYGLRRRRVDRQERERRVAELLAMIGMEGYERRRPDQLSAGQQQRVALARALAPEPRTLLLDEPLSALDAAIRYQLRDELRRVQRRVGITTIMVTHDQEEALAIADRVAVMNEGRLEQVGTPWDLYDRPRTHFVARFVGRGNFLQGEWRPEGVLLPGFGVWPEAASSGRVAPAAEPTAPAAEPGSTEPTGPIEPTEPSEATGPTDPAGPTGSTEPTEPTDPAGPIGPTGTSSFASGVSSTSEPSEVPDRTSTSGRTSSSGSPSPLERTAAPDRTSTSDRTSSSGSPSTLERASTLEPTFSSEPTAAPERTSTSGRTSLSGSSSTSERASTSERTAAPDRTSTSDRTSSSGSPSTSERASMLERASTSEPTAAPERTPTSDRTSSSGSPSTWEPASTSEPASLAGSSSTHGPRSGLRSVTVLVRPESITIAEPPTGPSAARDSNTVAQDRAFVIRAIVTDIVFAGERAHVQLQLVVNGHVPAAGDALPLQSPAADGRGAEVVGGAAGTGADGMPLVLTATIPGGDVPRIAGRVGEQVTVVVPHNALRLLPD